MAAGARPLVDGGATTAVLTAIVVGTVVAFSVQVAAFNISGRAYERARTGGREVTAVDGATAT